MLAHFFGLVLLTGFIFIVIWAVRFATKQQLKHAISWFLAIGIVGMLLGGIFGLPFRHMGAAGWKVNKSFMIPFAGSDGNTWFGCQRAIDAQKAGSASSAARK